MRERRHVNGIPLVEPGGKYFLQHREASGIWVATSADREPTVLRSAMFVITLPAGDRRAKVLQVIWQRTEVGVSICVPYFLPRHAIVGLSTLDIPVGRHRTVSMLERGKISRQKVKMTFHRSGEAHISATRTVQPISTETTPLTDVVGHIFTFHCRGPEAFEAVQPRDLQYRPEVRQNIDVPYAPSDNLAVKMIGRWYPLSRVRVQQLDLEGSDTPGWARLETENGTTETGVLLAPPHDWGWGRFGLFITFGPFNDAAGMQQPYAMLIGGFGQHSTTGRTDAGIKFLSVMYTNRATEIDALEKQLGSVDVASPELGNKRAAG